MKNLVFLNKVQKLTPILYNANDMGKELSDDLLFESQDILKSEEEKRLKVKQTKNPLSYHGFVYGGLQLTDFPKAPFKRKDTNVKRFFKEAQLATYDAKLWQNRARKQFCNLKHHIEQTLKAIWFKQVNIDDNVWSNPLSSDVRLKIEVQKILKDEIEPHVKNLNLSFEYFEKHLVTEMREDLKYVHSLEDEFDEKCLILDIQKEFFTNQIESFKSKSVCHEKVNENFEQTSSLKSENLCLKKKITELSKEAADVKEELSKRIAQFEKHLAILEAQSISFQLKLQEKNEKMSSENSLTSVLKEKEKIFEEKCDDTNIKFDFDEFDTKNLELEHAVASLQKENEHLKQTYKNLFDSIKRSRVQNQFSNKSDSQIVPNHLFEKEKSVLQKKIVELEKTVAQQTKDFGDAKNDFSIETDKYEKYFAHLENQNASLQEKLASSDHLSLQKEYNDLRTSYNALKAKFDVLNRSKGKSQVSNESKPQVSVSEKVYTGESSKPFSKKVSQFTTYSLQKGRKLSKRPNFSETFTPQKVSTTSAHKEKNQGFQTPYSRFTPVKPVWKPKQSRSKHLKYSYSEMLPLQQRNGYAWKNPNSGRFPFISKMNFRNETPSFNNGWKTSSSSFKTPRETPSFSNNFQKQKSFKSPLIPRALFQNETPVFSPRWNSTSLSRIDTTYKWISKYGNPVGAVLKWVPKVVV